MPSFGKLGLNETIDLVDDDEEEEQKPQEQVAVVRRKSSLDHDDIIVLDETEESDVSYCGGRSPVGRTPMRSSVRLRRSTTKSEATTDSEEIEIVGVRIVAPLKKSQDANRSAILNSSLNRSKSSGRRRSSLSMSSVQQAIKRAKLRISVGPSSSSSNSILSRTAITTVTSRVSRGRGSIKKPIKNKKKRKQKKQQNQMQLGCQTGGARYQFRHMTRRCTVPMYDTSRELGPANPLYKSANYIPLPGRVTRFGMPGTSSSTRLNLWETPSMGVNPFLIPTKTPSGPNVINVGTDSNVKEPGSKRPIVIDGSNVAMAHGNNQFFSPRGIQICVKFFLDRGHTDVTAFVPQYRTKMSESVDTKILDELNKQGVLKYTPCREVNGHRITAYDDRFIVQCAAINNGIIISNDNYKDLYKEEPDWRDTIEKRILQYTWVNQEWLMFPKDPLGRNGPSLDQLLLF